MTRAGLILAGGLLAAAGFLFAQDPFEIHVLEYENPHLGEFTIENHLNYVGRGTHEFDGPVAPTQDQFHTASGFTGGLNDFASFGVMQLNARVSGSSSSAAGWRLVPHFYAPERWHWPIKVGLVTEFSFEKAVYEGSSRRIEMVPILEKSFGWIQVDLNPGFGRAIGGAPGARLGIRSRGEDRLRSFPTCHPQLGILQRLGSCNGGAAGLPADSRVLAGR